MNCRLFEEQISEYLDQGMPRHERRQFCEHLLGCPGCRELFDDIRESIDLCRGRTLGTTMPLSATSAVEYLPPSISGQGIEEGLDRRILNNATIGEMVSCRTLDHLIGDYFEGGDGGRMDDAIAGHLATCRDCSMLMSGLRGAIEEDGDDLPEFDLPIGLRGRILAATVGNSR